MAGLLARHAPTPHTPVVPLLMLQAENDPIKPYGLQQALEAATCDSGAPLVLAVTPEGGHSLTWPEGWRAEASWGERVVVEWARERASHSISD